MIQFPTADRVEGVDATVGIVDGRVSMSVQVTTDLRVGAPERTPLSTHEPHLELRVASNDVRVVLDLDGDGLEQLADALADVREDNRFDSEADQ
jgi:hypothetical protein